MGQVLGQNAPGGQLTQPRRIHHKGLFVERDRFGACGDVTTLAFRAYGASRQFGACRQTVYERRLADAGNSA